MEKYQIDKEYIYKLYGYEDAKEDRILVPSDKLFYGIRDISELKRFQGRPMVRIRKSTKGTELQGARYFFKRHLRLHDIPYKGILNKLDLQFLMHIEDVSKAARLCNATNISINPFRLPVSFKGVEETDTMVVVNSNFVDDEEFYKAIELSYRKIILNRNITELTESSYVHEIAHTQLSSTRGMVKYYANSEVIPIFLELLDLYESESEDLRLVGDITRLNELFDHISILYTANMDGVEIKDGDLVNSTVYAESIIKAYQLLVKYITGNAALRKYILMFIQQVFNGKRQLEEMLDKFEITLESGVEDQKLLKYFNREI